MAACKEPVLLKNKEGTVTPDIEELLNIYIQTAEDLIKQCQGLQLKDAKKLEKKCTSELKYLQSLKQRRKDVKDYDVKVQEHDLKSSNLSHFSAILHAVHHLPGVTKILSPFSTKQRSDSLVVDVVAQEGRVWVKVIARKAQALHLIWAGKGQYGDRDIVRQAEDYIKCASEHPINFTSPEVHYAFYNEVTETMATALEATGVKVWGNRIPVAPELEYLVSSNDICSDDETEINKSDSDENGVSDTDDDSGDFHIPSASEFKSIQKKCDNSLKQFDMQSKNDNFYSKFSKNCDLESKRATDNISRDFSANLNNENVPLRDMKTESRFIHVDDIRAENKTIKVKDENLFPSILGSAPVYNFPDITIAGPSLSDSSMLLDVCKVNLDITTMITLVSSITHGGCNFIFKEKILSSQAKEERESPVLPELQKYLKDKDWYVCQTAVDDFLTILDTLGGENEKKRSEDLLKKCIIVPDQPSSRAQRLPETGKIRDRSKTIFGTGDQLKCVTVSANSGFVRAAEHQGVVFAVYLHQSRALTERKEKFADPLVE